MEHLSVEVGETVHLAILQGQNILFLESIESQKALRVVSRIGVHLPANCTAGGKALLARLSPEELRKIFPSEQLPTLMPHSLASREELERELKLVRKRGYATNHDESEPSVSAVAAVIEDRMEQPRAALTVSAPVSRLNQEQEEVIAAAVLRTAAEIGKRVV